MNETDKILNQNKKQSNTKLFIALTILIIILIPFTISIYNNRQEEKKNKENSFYVEETENTNTKENLDNKEIIDEKENVGSQIVNSYCDTDLIPEEKDYEEFIYYSAIDNGCALIEKENSKVVGDYTTKAYNKALSLKSDWSNKYQKESDNNTSFTYGKYTVRNRNGNILGWAVTLTYNTGLKFETYALDKNNDWQLIKNNKY